MSIKQGKAKHRLLRQLIQKKKQLSKAWIKLKKNIVYRFKLEKMRTSTFFEYQLRRHILTFTCWTIIYFIFLFILSFGLGNFIILHSLKPQALSYLAGAAAMIGGILAIVSSLSLFLMQNAAENFSFGFYKISARDKVQDIIYFFIIISVVLLFCASLFTQDQTIILFQSKFSLGKITLQASIFLIGLILYLIYYLYRRVFTRMQPISAINQAKDSSISVMRNLSKRVKAVADVAASNPKSTSENSAEEYEAYIYQRSSPIGYLNERLSYLFDFHDKLLSKDEKSLAIIVLDSIADIIKTYFLIRSSSSLVVPTEYIFATTSDSQAFLTPNLERMVAVGANYARNYDNIRLVRK